MECKYQKPPAGLAQYFHYDIYINPKQKTPAYLIPSHPLSICPLQKRASEMRSGSRPFKSTDARQPWNPSFACTSLGKDLNISLATPPIYKSPVEKK